MTSRDFCFWLQGCFELAAASSTPGEIYLDKTQTECVRRHLALVFKHEIDPAIGGNQKELQAIHDGEPLDKIGDPSVVKKNQHLASQFISSNPDDMVMRC